MVCPFKVCRRGRADQSNGGFLPVKPDVPLRTVSVSVPTPAPTNRPSVVRISPDLALAAASRLVSQANSDIEAAARRLVATAPSHGIDLSLIWATLETQGAKKRVRQACLAVPGAGRTAMLFISEPAPGGDPGGPRQALAERAAVLEAACEHLGKERSGRVQIAQALPEPGEEWFVEALVSAGFINVGHLAYLRRPAGPTPQVPSGPLPEGITLRRVSELPKTRVDATLVQAMERSYVDTLDCPELCGLRATKDILASHRETGNYDPMLWWVVYRDAEPHGCAFFSAVPDAKSSELVYLGLSPQVRGMGLGKRLLAMGLEEMRARHASWPMTLAVDRRNTVALRLYESFGFASFGERIAFVKPVRELAR
jgi:GNAT superfamily N-acetyltransferase